MTYQLSELQEKWLTALESGKYKQGRAFLGSPDTGLCCLGVLCVVAERDFDDGAFFPPHAVAEAARLRTRSGDSARSFMVNEFQCNGLPDANDNANATFPEIAAAIRANPENFFLPSEA